MSWQTSSRSKSLSFWFLILLGILAVVAVGLVLYKFNREMGRDMTPRNPLVNQNNPSGDSQSPIQEGTLTGFVSEIIGDSEASEKWITLSVTMPSAALPEEASASEVQTMQYHFYLGENLENTKDIHGGEMVTVSFPPLVSYQSEDGKQENQQYVAAENIEIMQ